MSLQTEHRSLSRFRTAALSVMAAGAMASLGFMLHVGHRNNSVLLKVLFTIWVLAPFAVLLGLDLISKRWSFALRRALYSCMLVLTLSSAVIYGAIVFTPPRPQPAAAFLLVPLASCLVIAVLPVAALLAGRKRRYDSVQPDSHER